MLYKNRLQALYAAVFILSSISISSCNLKLFSAVQIKASPELYVPDTATEYTADTYLSPKKLEELLHRDDGLDSSKKMHVYAYESAVLAPPEQKDQMRFLLHYPLPPIDLGMNGYLNDVPVNLEQTAAASFPEKAFAVPTVNANEQIDMAPSLNAAFLTKWNNIPTRSLPSLSGSVSIPMNELGVQSVTFGSDGILKFSLLNGAACTGAALKTDESSNVLSGNVDSSGNNITFSIENRTITRLDLTLQGVTGTGSIKPTFSGAIKRAEGVTANFDPFSINKTIPISSDDTFKQAAVKTGNAVIAIPEQAGWTATKATSVRQADPSGAFAGLSIDQLIDSTPPDGNLAGKRINGQAIVVTSNITVKLENATYDADRAKADFQLKVDAFSEVILSADGMPREQKVNIPIAAAVSAHVKSITFAKPAITVSIKNGFPAGNTIEAEVHSDQLGITPQTKSFEAPCSEVEHHFEGANTKCIPLNGADKLETTVTLKLPGYNEGNRTFKLQNVEPGKTFTFSGRTSFKGNWDSILLKVEKDISGKFPNDAGTEIDIASFTKVLNGMKLEVHDMPLYVYIGSDAFPTKRVCADFTLTAHTKSNGLSRVPMTLFERHSKELDFAVLPSGLLPAPTAAFTGKLPSAFVSVKKGASGVIKTIADVINSYPDSLQLEYTGKVADIEISYEEFKKLKAHPELGKLKQDIMWDVPVGFHAGSDGKIFLKKKLTGTKASADVFGRSEASLQDVHNLIDAFLRSASLQLKITNTTDVTATAVLTFVDLTGTKIGIEDKAFTLSPGTAVKIITFTKEECKKLAETCPVCSQIVVKLVEGDYYVKKNSKIQGELTVAADIDYKVQLGY